MKCVSGASCRGAIVCVLLLAGLLAGGLSPAASQTSAGTRSWRLERSGLAPSLTVGDSVLLTSQSGSSSEELVNGDSGVVAAVAVPQGCEPTEGSATQILYTCVGAENRTEPELYTPATQTWSVPNTGALDDICHSAGIANCIAVALGTDWIEWDASSCIEGEHCTEDLLYQNIATGQIQQSVTDGGASVWDDPNRAGLTHPICRPLTVPDGFNEDGFSSPYVPGSIQFLGRYAVMTGYFAPGPGTQIAECGSAFHETLKTSPDEPPLAASGNDVVWISAPRAISYAELSTRRAGSWTVPNRVGDLRAVAIAGDSLYLDGDGSAWTAHLPAQSR
jgi:hypothetical protein